MASWREKFQQNQETFLRSVGRSRLTLQVSKLTLAIINFAGVVLRTSRTMISFPIVVLRTSCFAHDDQEKGVAILEFVTQYVTL